MTSLFLFLFFSIIDYTITQYYYPPYAANYGYNGYYPPNFGGGMMSGGGVGGGYGQPSYVMTGGYGIPGAGYRQYGRYRDDFGSGGLYQLMG